MKTMGRHMFATYHQGKIMNCKLSYHEYLNHLIVVMCTSEKSNKGKTK
jgi:hypothetical protein